MATAVVTVGPAADIREVAALMLAHQVI